MTKIKPPDQCPRCKNSLDKKKTLCPFCEFDFTGYALLKKPHEIIDFERFNNMSPEAIQNTLKQHADEHPEIRMSSLIASINNPALDEKTGQPILDEIVGIVDTKQINLVLDTRLCQFSFYFAGLAHFKQQNYERSVHYHKISSHLGFYRANLELASMFLLGKGVSQDIEKAFPYIEKIDQLLEQDTKPDDDLTVSMGYALLSDFNFAINQTDLYIQNLKLAAQFGNYHAQQKLSECYQYGVGVEMSSEQAHYWSDQAYLNPNKKIFINAKQNLNRKNY
jgi:TPR repeat protein